jgi:hypothetical protein
VHGAPGRLRRLPDGPRFTERNSEKKLGEGIQAATKVADSRSFKSPPPKSHNIIVVHRARKLRALTNRSSDDWLNFDRRATRAPNLPRLHENSHQQVVESTPTGARPRY